MSDELKKCPFCGGEGTLHQDNNPPHNYWWVACYNNDCPSMPQATTCKEGEIVSDRQEAIEAWNNRPESTLRVLDEDETLKCFQDYEAYLRDRCSEKKLDEIIFKILMGKSKKIFCFLNSTVNACLAKCIAKALNKYILKVKS